MIDKKKIQEDMKNSTLELTNEEIVNYWKYASAHTNKEWTLKALAHQPQNLMYVCQKLKQDKEVLFVAVSKNPTLFLTLQENMQEDEELVLALLEENAGSIYPQLSNKFRNDKKIAWQVVSDYPGLFNSMGGTLKNDKELLLLVISCIPQFGFKCDVTDELWEEAFDEPKARYKYISTPNKLKEKAIQRLEQLNNEQDKNTLQENLKKQLEEYKRLKL